MKPLARRRVVGTFSVRAGKHFLASLFGLCLLAIAACPAGAADKPALKVLFLTGGGYHDYAKLVPFLTGKLSGLIRVAFDVRYDTELLKNPNFADAYDAVVYDLCWENADEPLVNNALNAARSGKPTVMVHCALHAFKQSQGWRDCCGMTSRVHDPYEPFATEKLDPRDPITLSFPDEWKTAGDELYQTIKMDEHSKPLLKVVSPHDGRVHMVCWTSTYGKGRVFGTTLGHDMKTVAQPEYVQLLANGLLWTCGKLEADGKPAPGYAAAK
ncbi:MAG: ThuA domain-containing protein [Limisphaerales bacterium]